MARFAANQSDLIKQYALAGARLTLVRIAAEREQILATFPELNGAPRPGRTPRKRLAEAPAPAPAVESAPAPVEAPAHGRPSWNAAQRRAIGRRMRAYWASQRAEGRRKGAGR